MGSGTTLDGLVVLGQDAMCHGPEPAVSTRGGSMVRRDGRPAARRRPRLERVGCPRMWDVPRAVCRKQLD